MDQRMDTDVTRYQRATLYRTSCGGPALETGDREEGPRGTIDGYVTTNPSTIGTIILRNVYVTSLLLFKDLIFTGNRRKFERNLAVFSQSVAG